MNPAIVVPADTLLPDEIAAQRPTVLGRIRLFIIQKPLAAAGAFVIVGLLFLGAFGPSIAPQRYDDFDARERLEGPSMGHLFGTDERGRDVFSRVLYAARVTVLIGFGATAVATVMATALGVSSGHFGGIYDTMLQRLLEIWMAFPGLIFIIFVVSIFTPSTLSVLLTIGFLFSAGTSRIIRSATLAVEAQPYIEAARAGGASDLRIVLFHVLPNIYPLVIVTASLQIGSVILAESSLSFLGFGSPPPFPSWGGMLQDAQRFMQSYPHLAIFPGAAIALVVYSMNMLGDGLRDVLDPRLRGSR